MSRLKQIFVYLSIILQATPLFAQTGKLYNTENGLSSSFANQVFQDSRGLIWIPTRNGLNIFDGYHFNVFKRESTKQPGLTSNYIIKVVEDRHGNMVLGTNRGVLVYNGHAFFDCSIYNDVGQRVKSYVQDLIVLRNGTLLAATSGYGVMTVVNDSRGYHCRKALGPMGNQKYVKRLMEDSRGNIWMVTEDSHVMMQTPKGRLYTHVAGADGIEASALAEDAAGNIYLGSASDGVWVMRRGDRTFKRIEAIGHIPVWCMYVAPSGKLYIGSDGRGVMEYYPSTGNVVDNPFYTNRTDLSHGKVNTIFQDKQGNIWLSMLQKGVFMQPALDFDFHYIGYRSAATNTIGGNCVISVLVDRDGHLWVGTDRDGIYMLDGNGSLIRHFTDVLTVEALYQDIKGRVWAGTYQGGCGYFENGSYHAIEYMKGLSVFDIKGDRFGRIWLGTLGNGLVCIKPDGSHKIYTMKKGADINGKVNALPNNFLVKMAFSPDQRRLFIATTIGLSCLNTVTGSWTDTFGTNCLERGKFTHGIYVDRKGRVWLGADDGLYCHDKQHWQKPLHYTIQKGLPDNCVSFISEDRKGRLWLGTNHGLCCLNASTGKTVNFFVGNGLQSNEFSDGAVSVSADGRTMIIGGTGGINVFDPTNMKARKWNATVNISKLVVGTSIVAAGSKSGIYTITDKPPYDSQKFVLSHEDNTFSLDLTTMTYNNVEQVSYAYSINNEAWTTLPQGQNVLSFSHLPAGTYQFRVKALYNGQESAIKEFTVLIHPAWYASWIAKLIYLLLAAVAVWQYMAYRKRKEQERLTLQEHIHAEEMGEAKIRFFVNISHDIRTPLTLILSPLLSLIKTDKDPKRQNTYALMKRNAERILHLVNQMMDLRKIDKGKMTMHMAETDMVGFIDDEYQLFQQQARTKNIEFTFKHDDGSLPVWIDRDNFDKVVVNLLSNAFKFTPAGGHVTISLAHTDTDAVITVSDNGCGIPQDKIDTIFQRFYQAPTHESDRNMGTGIGLDLARSLVELHYGTIKAHNNPEGGASFVVTLPLGCKHLKPEEKDSRNIDAEAKTNKSDRSILADVEVDTPQAEEQRQTERNRMSIAVVEDDEEIAAYLKGQLDGEFRVCTYPNGKVALAGILKDIPDLVISDVMMPEMDGTTLCAKLKANINTNHVPVILLTAKSRDEDKLEGLETGADAYVVKPFNMDILRRTILNLLAVRRTLKNKFTGQESQEDKVDDVGLQSPDDKLMERIMNVINSNLSDSELSVDDIADKAGISRVHLYRKMKEITNQTPHNFIKNLRLKQAAKLLADPHQSITEVMYAVGFSNAASFSTMFKSMYGLSPRDYQRSKQQQQ